MVLKQGIIGHTKNIIKLHLTVSKVIEIGGTTKKDDCWILVSQ
jgi:hypothetical protein